MILKQKINKMKKGKLKSLLRESYVTGGRFYLKNIKFIPDDVKLEGVKSFDAWYAEKKSIIEEKNPSTEDLINEFIKEELPDANSAYHHEAEIAAGFRLFIKWMTKKNIK
jgi:hypothetical protein